MMINFSGYDDKRFRYDYQDVFVYIFNLSRNIENNLIDQI